MDLNFLRGLQTVMVNSAWHGMTDPWADRTARSGPTLGLMAWASHYRSITLHSGRKWLLRRASAPAYARACPHQNLPE